MTSPVLTNPRVVYLVQVVLAIARTLLSTLAAGAIVVALAALISTAALDPADPSLTGPTPWLLGADGPSCLGRSPSAVRAVPIWGDLGAAPDLPGGDLVGPLDCVGADLACAAELVAAPVPGEVVVARPPVPGPGGFPGLGGATPCPALARVP